MNNMERLFDLFKAFVKFSNFNSGFINSIYTFLTLFILISGFFVLKENKKSNKINEAIREDNIRPLLVISDITSDDEYMPQTCKIFIENLGNSVAQIEKIKLTGIGFLDGVFTQPSVPDYIYPSDIKNKRIKKSFEIKIKRILKVNDSLVIEIDEKNNEERIWVYNPIVELEVTIYYKSIILPKSYTTKIIRNKGKIINTDIEKSK